MIILKIGGSILTEKDSAEPKVDYENLNRIAEEIRQSLYAEEISNDLIDGLVIVHGAGSFGHPPAKKYQIGQPFEMKDYLEKRIGFAEVQNEVKKLNSIICESLIEHGIPVIAIPPSSFITSHNKRIYDFDLNLIKTYLSEGFVPVLFGDVVIDDEVNSIEDIKFLESTTNVDVTGGMVGKVKELLDLADYGISSEIINANEEGAILKALQGMEVNGTKICRK